MLIRKIYVNLSIQIVTTNKPKRPPTNVNLRVVVEMTLQKLQNLKIQNKKFWIPEPYNGSDPTSLCRTLVTGRNKNWTKPSGNEFFRPPGNGGLPVV